jgi:hypothetical protein
MYVIYKTFEVHKEHNVLPIERKSGECSMADKFQSIFSERKYNVQHYFMFNLALNIANTEF